MSLVSVPITNQLEWLSLALVAAAPNSFGLPTGYEGYVKLLPPLGIDRRIPIASYSFAQRTVADLNARAAFWDAHGIRQGQPPVDQLERITYRQAATLAGMPDHEPISSEAMRQFYGGWPPHLGSSPALEEAFVQQLVQVLGPIMTTLFYGSVEEGTYHWDEDGLPIDWLEQGVSADLLTVYRRDKGLPAYSFAADHTWCLYKVENAEWLAVGCSAAMAQALREHPYLEAFPLLYREAKSKKCQINFPD
ncbi:hypothetical protein MTX78_15125 [Hymenobacter tibetensis]|uniref:SMI1/KNR4 family protein n=1 Tax=Hymenobacter tibetensis TaxID=497967 RepID=A0ABY4CTL6_9BACT|nr:hypothetical protein [Hymenobacter tibetensis]UOG73456.1 hypothetical protein MTX78_15125 [Hymenobacter tibetensis]